MEIICKENFKTNEWAGGITREVCILPAEGSSLQDRNFELRVSSAVINTTESTFSDFTGFTRQILCLEGRITLCVEGQTVDLSSDNLFEFDGAAKVSSVNTPGAVDLNVIYKRGTRVRARVKHGEHLFTDVERMLVFAIGSQTTLNGTSLRQHDAAWVSGDVRVSGHVLCVEM